MISWTGMGFLFLMQDIRELYPIIGDIAVFFSSRLFFAFVPVAIIFLIYWFVDKRSGEIIGLSCGSSMLIADIVKFGVAQPRPWDLNPGIEKVVGSEASGYSFPSWHVATCAGTYFPAAILSKSFLIGIPLIILTFCIALSRMVLCAHTPLDVFGGFLFAILCIFFAWRSIDYSYRDERRFHLVNLAYVIVFGTLIIIALVFWNGDLEYIVGRSGLLFGMILGRELDHRFLNHTVERMPTKQMAKWAVLGTAAIAVIVAVPYLLIPGYGGFIGSFLAMIWGFYVFPKIMADKRKQCGSEAVGGQ